MPLFTALSRQKAAILVVADLFFLYTRRLLAMAYVMTYINKVFI